MDPRSEKARLRATLRAARRAVPPNDRARAARSAVAVARQHPGIAGARSLLGYLADDGELDIGELLADASAAGTRTFLPRIEPGGLCVASWSPGAPLAGSGPRGLREPIGAPVEPALQPAPRCALIPAVALDLRGNRLGRGAGHYDRLLPALRRSAWLLVGVCPEAALLDAVPVETHDVALDAVLTETRLVLVAEHRLAR